VVERRDGAAGGGNVASGEDVGVGDAESDGETGAAPESAESISTGSPGVIIGEADATRDSPGAAAGGTDAPQGSPETTGGRGEG
jgi:hypothetical protein